MIKQLVTIDPALTARDIADVLWLAQHLSAAPEAGAGLPAPPGTEERDGAGPPEDTTPADRAAGPADLPPVDEGPSEPGDGLRQQDDRQAPPAADGEPPETLAAPSSVEVRLPPVLGRLGESPGEPIRLPTVAALPDAQGLARALRPLRLRQPSRSDRVLDEWLTVDRTARTRIVLPVVRPRAEQRLQLTVLFDVGTTMWMWPDTVAELVALFRRSAAFRRVELRFMDPGRPGPVRFATAATEPPALRSPASLLDPAGETAVIVFSDCLGEAWADGRMSAVLARLATTAPVAIIHSLPQRVWGRGRIPVSQLEFHSAAPATPAARVGFRDLDLESVDPAAGPPRRAAIPLFEFSARGLGAWARLVGGSGQRVRAAAFYADGSTLSPIEAVPPLPPSREERLAQARLLPSQTFKLATHLAAVPLRKPIIRLMHRIVVPDAPPTALAEIVASGLLEPQRVAERGHPFDVEYHMDPVIRAELVFGLARSTRREIVEIIFNYFQANEGSPLDFLAFVSAPELAASSDAPVLARLNADFLRGLGGQYAKAVADWEHRVRIARATVARETAAEPVASGLDVASPRTAPARDDRGIDRDEHVGGDVIGHGLEGQPVEGHLRKIPAVWGGVPPKNPNFTGRETLLEQLHDQLAVSVTAVLPNALHGLGGVGKTQLATEYAYRYRAEYDLVWWVPAHEASAIRDALVRLAERLGLSTVDRAAAVHNVLEALRRGEPYSRWLLVYDNADDIATVDDYLPMPTHHVLITSRDIGWANRGPVIEVDVFTREESVRMLLRRAPTLGREDADEIAEELGDLPLALEQAAAWHEGSAMPGGEYLQLFREHRERLLQQHASGHYAMPVAVTWRVSIERLNRTSPAAAQLMELMAYFSPEPISVDMLARGSGDDVPAPLRDALGDPVLRNTTVQEVIRYGLARLDPVNRALVVHRLVQAVIRDETEPGRRRELRQARAGILARATPGFPDRASTWRRHSELAPHVLYALDDGILEDDHPDVRELLLQQIRFKYQRGEYESSRELAERVCRAWERRLGPPEQWDEPKLLADRYLANALRSVGDADAARELNQRTYHLLLTGERFGPDHPYVLLVGLSVGADLRNSGDLHAARDHDTQNLERIRRQEPIRANLLNLARALNNLAIDHRLLFEFDRALELDLEAFRVRQDFVDDKLDPFDYEVNANIVRDLYGLGEYQDARTRLEEYLPGHRATVGVENPNYLLALRTQAILLRKLGDYVESRSIAEENYRKHRIRFGPNHEHTLSTQMTLSNTLRVNGEYAEAVRLGEAALRHYRDHFAPDHPFTLICAINLAIAMRLNGDAEGARRLNLDTMDRLRRHGAPEDHPPLLCCANNLANDLTALGRPLEALEHSRLAADRFYQRYGAHPYALGCQHNYALDLIATGDLAGGTALRDEVGRALREHSYPEHPELLGAREGYRFELDLEPPPM
ncbi:tetratricopeptide repeat protein [Dactylosporangium roseum]|uniref:Tetratricopeptide repeat protein n=1 Tax=Dactylosporangium roseum TaxID=47989 RepID=A0ABY5Z0X2_9ACTN|nr:FxSxx-COOH system tetratricopeptide repeat protein [Dactylosporangium roseum]UWZ34139.1 tetratricopeptide repeat protein [Dactylosporangium roseum]